MKQGTIMMQTGTYVPESLHVEATPYWHSWQMINRADGNLLDRDLPASNRVALFAVRAQLALVNVRVAVLASLSNAGENRLDVALRASHGLVHAAQRIARPVVIEFRNCADRLPGARRMAVLAGHVQWSVGAVRAARSLSPCTSHIADERQRQYRE